MKLFILNKIVSAITLWFSANMWYLLTYEFEILLTHFLSFPIWINLIKILIGNPKVIIQFSVLKKIVSAITFSWFQQIVDIVLNLEIEIVLTHLVYPYKYEIIEYKLGGNNQRQKASAKTYVLKKIVLAITSSVSAKISYLFT